MAYEYAFPPEAARKRDAHAQVVYHVRESLESAIQAIRACREREEFPALMDLLLACKNAEEAVEG